MAKRNQRQQQDQWTNSRRGRGFEQPEAFDASYDAPKRFVRPPPVTPLTEALADLLGSMKGNTITFGVGPAGTGKTYTSAAYAEQQLFDKRIEQIIITRPAVDADEDLGALPGELEEKFAPYLQPFEQCFVERMGRGGYDYALKHGKIKPMTIAHMRGITFKDAIVLLDEAQNLTPKQMKMFLTRIGSGCKVVITGDENQSDIKGPNGLTDALTRLPKLPGVRVIQFGREDIVRHGLVQLIVEAYEG